MGAVTAILYCELNAANPMSHVSCLVLDSPFVNINTLAQDVADQNSNIPTVFVNMAMAVVKTTIREKLQFEINELQPFESINNVNVPIIFHVGRHDVLVKPSRVRAYYEKYRGNPKKQFIDSDCDHGGERDEHYYDECLRFIDNVFLSEQFSGNFEKNNGNEGGSSLLRKAMNKALHGNEYGSPKQKATGPQLKDNPNQLQKYVKGDQSPAPYSPMGIQPQNRLSQIKNSPIRPLHDQRMLVRQQSETLDFMYSSNRYGENPLMPQNDSFSDIRRNQFISKPRAQSGYGAEIFGPEVRFSSRMAGATPNHLQGNHGRSNGALIFDQEGTNDQSFPQNSHLATTLVTQGASKQKQGMGFGDLRREDLRKGKKNAGNDWGPNALNSGLFRSPQLTNAGSNSRQGTLEAKDLMNANQVSNNDQTNEVYSEQSIGNMNRLSNIQMQPNQGQPMQKPLNEQQKELLRNMMNGNQKDHSAPGSFSSNKLDGTTTAAELSGFLRQGPLTSGYNARTIFEVREDFILGKLKF